MTTGTWNLRLLLTSALLAFSFSALIAGDYQKAWEALLKNDRLTARALLQKALNDPKDGGDAAMTLVLLDFFDGNPEGSDYWEQAESRLKDPYPYYFAFWFMKGAVGDYGIKTENQLKRLDRIVNAPDCPGMIKASAHYQLGHYLGTKKQLDEMHRQWALCTNITRWQCVGPFDNISDSGFDKNYPPVAHPKPNAVFKSAYQTDIHWISATDQENAGWLAPGFHIRYETAVVYAQSFVTAQRDMEVFLGAGVTGNIKVWVNDRLLISEAEQRRTDFDAYRVKCRLRKGANRILVQLGYVNDGDSNFCIRLTDAAGHLIPNLASSAEYRPYTADTQTGKPELLPFFAEAFFEKKIQDDPDNPLNYYLLCKTYLRNKKSQQALQSIEKMMEREPNSTVFRYLRLDCHRLMNNSTGQTEDLQFIKDNDPETLLTLISKYNEAKENEQYEEAAGLLAHRIRLYGENEDTWNEKLQLAALGNRIDELLKLIDTASNRYPASVAFAQIRHAVAVKLRKDPRAAIAVYENFLQRNYNFSIAQALIQDYFEQGMNDKAVQEMQIIASAFPYDPELANNLLNYYYGQSDHRKAKEQVDKMLRLAPFHALYWNNAAHLAEQMNDRAEALRCFKKALYYDPNDYDTRRRLRELEQLPELSTYLPQNNVYELFKNSDRAAELSPEYHDYYILDEKSTVIYPERNSEIYHTIVVKVLDEDGINYWKESSIGFNENYQRLIIEKAEVLKPSGARISAEQHENQLVFPNLQAGDGIHIRYRLINYTLGRMSKEFWDMFGFNGFVPVEKSRYTLLVHKDIPLQYRMNKAEHKPVVKDVEDFRLYQWESSHEPAIADEQLMPVYADVGKMLHLSTIPNWKVVADWYADLSAPQAKTGYEVRQLVETLLPPGAQYTETEKARRIYDYIVRNIRYSSVPFRQGAYVPQRAAKVIQTKLGDCKDLATLYAALAREAGLKANLVLVNTRENGEQTLILPGVEFNHCIVKVIADGKVYFLELTNSELPFASLPNEDLNAQALEIPFESNASAPKLFLLNPDTRVRDIRWQAQELQIKNRDFDIVVSGYRSGNAAAIFRASYKSLSRQKRLEELQKNIASGFTNPVTVKEAFFGDMEILKDTLQFGVQYSVKNEVLEIGEIGSFKLPFYSLFIKSGLFQEENRVHPLNYWRYEDCDAYVEEITIHLPDGKQFTEIPADADLQFNGTTYTLRFERQGAATVRVVRDIRINRADIPAGDYPGFRQFAEAVTNAETRYLAFR